MSRYQDKKKKGSAVGTFFTTVLLIASLGVFCYAGYKLCGYYQDYKVGTDEYKELRTNFGSDSDDTVVLGDHAKPPIRGLACIRIRNASRQIRAIHTVAYADKFVLQIVPGSHILLERPEDVGPGQSPFVQVAEHLREEPERRTECRHPAAIPVLVQGTFHEIRPHFPDFTVPGTGSRPRTVGLTAFRDEGADHIVYEMAPIPVPDLGIMGGMRHFMNDRAIDVRIGFPVRRSDRNIGKEHFKQGKIIAQIFLYQRVVLQESAMVEHDRTGTAHPLEDPQAEVFRRSRQVQVGRGAAGKVVVSRIIDDTATVKLCF